MREYGRVFSVFWSSNDMRSLSEDGRMLALYLMSCPHATSAGVFRLPDGYVCEDLQWSAERVSEGFAELLSKGFANRCGTTKWVWICKHLHWNPPENPNQAKGVRKAALQVPDECAWKLDFMRVCGPSLGLEVPKESNPSETVSEPFRNTESESESESETKKALRAMSGKPDVAPEAVKQQKRSALTADARTAIEFLNKVTKHSYRADLESNLGPARARVSEFGLPTVKRVIADRCDRWGDDPKMSEYLRPATLFAASNFANYAGQLPALTDESDAVQAPIFEDETL